MTTRAQDRLLAACGIGCVVLELAGALVATAGAKTRELTVSDTTAKLVHAFATPASPASWAGAYLELLSVGLFLAFATWVAARLGGGLLGSLVRATATAYAAVTAVSLGVLAAIAYRAGHGLGLDAGRALVTTNEALYVTSWFLAAFFLAAAGLLALGAGRRLLGGSALAAAALTLAGVVAFDGAGQLTALVWMLWIVGASVSLARGGRAAVAAPLPQGA